MFLFCCVAGRSSAEATASAPDRCALATPAGKVTAAQNTVRLLLSVILETNLYDVIFIQASLSHIFSSKSTFYSQSLFRLI